MPSLTQSAFTLAFVVALPLVHAHGYISTVVSDGKSYPGTSPEWFYQASKPDRAGWYAENQDNGFVSPSAYGTEDIVCHKNAVVGSTAIPVAAGGKLDLTWNTWPDSHHGPVITYMAVIDGDFSAVDKASLKWFKVKEGGLVSGSNPGTWATDELLANKLTDTVTVPASLKAGNYVVRHEIIALHSAGQEDGAQNYPQCLNVEVTGSGSTNPCSDGADCAVGTALYTADDPSIKISIYGTLDGYKIPGPALYGGGAGGSSETKVGGGTPLESSAPAGTAPSEVTAPGNGTAAPGVGEGGATSPAMGGDSTAPAEASAPAATPPTMEGSPATDGGSEPSTPPTMGGDSTAAAGGSEPSTPPAMGSGGTPPSVGTAPAMGSSLAMGTAPAMPTAPIMPTPPTMGGGGNPVMTGFPMPWAPTWKPGHHKVSFTA